MDRCLVATFCGYWNFDFLPINPASRISSRASRSERKARGTDQKRKYSKSLKNWKTNIENDFAGAQGFVNKLDVSLQRAGSNGNSTLLWFNTTILSESSFVEVWGNFGKNWLCSRSYPVTSYGRYETQDVLSPFSTRRICSRDAKRKQESGNVIG